MKEVREVKKKNFIKLYGRGDFSFYGFKLFEAEFCLGYVKFRNRFGDFHFFPSAHLQSIDNSSMTEILEIVRRENEKIKV